MEGFLLPLLEGGGPVVGKSDPFIGAVGKIIPDFGFAGLELGGGIFGLAPIPGNELFVRPPESFGLTGRDVDRFDGFGNPPEGV